MQALKALWARTEPARGPVLLLGGVLWDYLTLRIDRLLDNVLLGAYLLVLGLCIVLQLRSELGTGLPAFIEKRLHWAGYLASFLLGGLLSAYFIYYLNGAPLLRGVIWLMVLGTAAAAVELVRSWTKLPELWVPLYGAVAFHFGLAAVPVLWGDFIGPAVPLLLAIFLSGLVHFLAAIPWKRPDLGRLNRTLLGSSLLAAAVAAAELIAWKADLIPPLPLTLMDTRVEPEDHDAYHAGVFWDALASVGFPPTVQWTPGLRVGAHTAVFLPRRMETTVIHHWEHWRDDDWTETDAIRLDIRGGRDEGFRTYSRKRHLEPGAWRVRITTLDDRLLGSVRFDLEVAPPPEPTPVEPAG